MSYNVKSVKLGRGHDGPSMECNLYNGNKKIAEVWDDSYGGGFQYTWLDTEEREQFEKFLKTLGKIAIGKVKLDYDADIYVDELVQKVLHEREVKKRNKLCEKAIVVMTKGNDTKYSYYPMPHGKKIADLPKEIVQKWVREIEDKLNPNEYILNTNL